MAGALSAVALKDVRALLPVWIAGAAAIVPLGLLRQPRLSGIGMVLCGIGIVMLGAHSIGHEYAYRTLPSLLTLPVSRVRLFVAKFGMLAVMVGALGLLALAVLPSSFSMRTAFGEHSGFAFNATFLALAGLCALCVAPIMTMMCRSSLGGAVLTFFVPAMALGVSELLTVAVFGVAESRTLAAQQFADIANVSTVVVAALVGAVLTWRTFMRLEAVDGPDPEVELPIWARAVDDERATVPQARHRLWQLLAKELHLHQMAFVVTGAYVLGWATLTALRGLVPDIFGPPIAVITMAHAVLQALLVGALASAEERQYGTHEWHTLLPMSARQQWAIKAGVAVALVVTLSLGVPMILSAIHPAWDDYHLRPWDLVPLAALVSVSLYASSLSTSGLRALLVSMSIVPVALFLVVAARMFIEGARAVRHPPLISAPRPLVPIALAIFVLLLGLVHYLAQQNHASSERGARRVWRQAVVLVGCVLLGASTLAVANAWL